jgi:rhamnulokinase
MSNYYIACDLGIDSGRVMMGTLHKEKLAMSEIRRFQNVPVQEKNSLQWNIPQLYQDILDGLTEVGSYDEPANSVSCSSWAADYMLFESDGTLMTPVFHHDDPRSETGREEILSKVTWETIFAETGVQKTPTRTLFQLGAEKSRRLKKAGQLLPIGDGFNFLLSGVSQVELSLASTTQLYNPMTRTWSDRLIQAGEFPTKLFPQIVAAGTKLGALRPDIAKETGLDEAQVITACSHGIAAALAGLPINFGERWAYLWAGSTAIMGTELAEPIINDVSREWNFTNETGYGGTIRFSKLAAGVRILDECRRYWKQNDHEVDNDLLMHLAISAEPFESLIDPLDARFQTPGDMPEKIQAFCKETNQIVPRKPGPITRCIMESLALHYRKTLDELQYLSGRELTRLYILGDSTNSLLNSFIANALQIPVVVAPTDATAIGNAMIQAIALGHVESLEHAREIVRNSFKTETIVPHAAVWNAAYTRLADLFQHDPQRQPVPTPVGA